MLISEMDALCVLVDVQEKLVPSIHDKATLIHQLIKLSRVLQLIQLPTIVYEQYPKGLGETISELSILKNNENTFEKTTFSCANEPDFNQSLKRINRKQIILAGIETHVCVLQSAIELKEKGYQVYVLVDCVGARDERTHHLALNRMALAGVQLINLEMFIFEMVRHSKHALFKTMSNTFLK